MSRSTRAPIYTEGYGGKSRKVQKQKASRAARAAKELPNGAGYKRTFNSWDICDWKFYSPEQGYKVRRK